MNTEDPRTLLHRSTQFYIPRPTPLTKEYHPQTTRSSTDHDIRSRENPERNDKQEVLGHRYHDKWCHGGETKQVAAEWKEANMIILHKKGDMEDVKDYRPISLLSHMYTLFTRILQIQMEKILDGNQPREQAGFRKGYSTVDHPQTINQLIAKCNGFNRPLCIGYMDYVKKHLSP